MPTTVDGFGMSVGRHGADAFTSVPTCREDVVVRAFGLEIGEPREAEIAARMTLRGRPDASCADEVAEVLALIGGNVHVDVRACEYLDHEIVATLARAFQELGSRGHFLEVSVSQGDVEGVRALTRSGIPRTWLRVEA